MNDPEFLSHKNLFLSRIERYKRPFVLRWKFVKKKKKKKKKNSHISHSLWIYTVHDQNLNKQNSNSLFWKLILKVKNRYIAQKLNFIVVNKKKKKKKKKKKRLVILWFLSVNFWERKKKF